MEHLLRMSQLEIFAVLLALVAALLGSVVGAVWVYCDAARLGRGLAARFLWTLGTLALWPLFLPLWLLARPDEPGFSVEPDTAAEWNGETAADWREDSAEPEESASPGCLVYGVGLALLLALAVFCGALLVSMQRDADLETVIFGSPEAVAPPPAATAAPGVKRR